jgi:hypothetical protein
MLAAVGSATFLANGSRQARMVKYAPFGMAGAMPADQSLERFP